MPLNPYQGLKLAGLGILPMFSGFPATMPLNPYQGLKLTFGSAIGNNQVLAATMPLNPYQGLKHYINTSAGYISGSDNATESLSGIETF